MTLPTSGNTYLVACATGTVAIFAQIAALVLFSHFAEPEAAAGFWSVADQCVSLPAPPRISVGLLEISL